MKDNVKRLIARQCLDYGDTPEQAVHRVLTTPHGLFGVSNLMMETYLNPNEIEFGDIGIMAGEYPLVSGVMLSGDIYDQLNAPSAISIRYEGDEVVLEIPPYTENSDGVLLIEESVTDGYITTQAIDALKAAGKEVVLVMAIADKGEGGLERITEATGIPAYSLFKFSDFVEMTPEDHLYFRPDPNPNNGGYFWLNPEGAWEACSQDQNGYLEQHREQQVPTPHEDEDNVFYLKGILRV